jgi:hypothetical protein
MTRLGGRRILSESRGAGESKSGFQGCAARDRRFEKIRIHVRVLGLGSETILSKE